MSSGVPLRDTLPPGTRLREFELDDVLGGGGFGVMYRGWDTIDNVPVAVKEYMPLELAVRERNGDVCPKREQEEPYDWGLREFLKEARMLAGFRHPSIVRVHKLFEDHGTAYIVMEYIEGQTLSALYEAEKTLSEDRLRGLLAPILAALEDVHYADWLHRDIKPGNIMLRDADTPVLIDFGAAQAATAEHDGEARVVTPGFSPLEQYGRGDERYGPWTDLYALGAVLYRGMTGIIPPEAPDRVETDGLAAVEMVAKRRYSRQLTAAVDWALKLEARDRPQSIDEWREILERSGEPPSPESGAPVTPPFPGERRSGQKRWLVVVVMVVMLIAAVVFMW